MKYLSLIATLILMISCGNSTEDKSDLTGANHKVDLTVEGMVCSKGCVSTINKKLGGLDGVVEFEVVYDDKRATVIYDVDKINKEELIKNIESLHNGMYKISQSEEKCVKNCDDELNQENTPKELNPNPISDLTPEVSYYDFKLPNLFSLLNSLLH